MIHRCLVYDTPVLGVCMIHVYDTTCTTQHATLLPGTVVSGAVFSFFRAAPFFFFRFLALWVSGFLLSEACFSAMIVVSVPQGTQHCIAYEARGYHT